MIRFPSHSPILLSGVVGWVCWWICVLADRELLELTVNRITHAPNFTTTKVICSILIKVHSASAGPAWAVPRHPRLYSPFQTWLEP